MSRTSRMLMPCALVLAQPVVAAPSAVQAAPGGYTTYVACGAKTAGTAEHECDKGTTPVAVFVAKKHDASYRVCAKFPGKKEPLCATAQQAKKGKRTLNTITTTKRGTHKVTWYVGGRKVGTWKFTIV